MLIICIVIAACTVSPQHLCPREDPPPQATPSAGAGGEDVPAVVPAMHEDVSGLLVHTQINPL